MRFQGSLLAATLGAALFFANPATAQSTLAGAMARGGTGEGFLFGRPGAIVNLHGGFGQPSADSDIYEFVTDQLTLSESDFTGFAWGVSVFIPMSERLDLSLSGTYIGRSTGSEFRHLIDNNDLPIEQRTQLRRIPLLVGARFNVLPRGESIGNLAWVPSRVSVHVGVAGGTMKYRFKQVGDFVDFTDDAVFYDELLSEGWAPAAQLSAGMEVSVSTRLGVTAEASQHWSRAKLSRDFLQFDPIDLSGFSVLVGISLRV